MLVKMLSGRCYCFPSKSNCTFQRWLFASYVTKVHSVSLYSGNLLCASKTRTRTPGANGVPSYAVVYMTLFTCLFRCIHSFFFWFSAAFFT